MTGRNVGFCEPRRDRPDHARVRAQPVRVAVAIEVPLGDCGQPCRSVIDTDRGGGYGPAGERRVEVQPGDERIIAHLGFARAVASRSLDPRCRGADREDLIAWGVVGLVQAAQRYRGDLGASFGAYAARRVRGQVLDALRERDPLTRSARRAYREAQRIAEDLPPPYVEISLDRLAGLGGAGLAPPDAPAASGAPRHPRRDCGPPGPRAPPKPEP